LKPLVQLSVKTKNPAEQPADTTPRSTSDASPAATAESEPGAELDALLGSTEQDQTPTARARVLYAKAELARLRKQPAEEEKIVARIASDFKPEDLSPSLLGRAGDYLLGKGQLDNAAKFYQRLTDEFPKSENLDFA